MHDPLVDAAQCDEVQSLQHASELLAAARTLKHVQEIVRSAARRIVHADGATFVLRDGDRCF